MRTSETTRRAIISDFSLGLTQSEVAKKYERSRRTICRILKELKQESPEAVLAQDGTGYKERLKQKAVRAVEAALDDSSHSYRRGTIGVRVLSGLGEFVPEPQSIINLTHITQGAQYAVKLGQGVERRYYGHVEDAKRLTGKTGGEAPEAEQGAVEE